MTCARTKQQWFEAEILFASLSELNAATPALTAVGFEVDPRLDWRDPECWDDEDGVFIVVRMQMQSGEEDAFHDAVAAVIAPFDCFLSCWGAGWSFYAYPTGYAPMVTCEAEIVFATQPCADGGMQALLAAGFVQVEPFSDGIVVRSNAYSIAHFVGDMQPIIDPHGGFIRSVRSEKGNV